jgi:hypothetical protein
LNSIYSFKKVCEYYNKVGTPIGIYILIMKLTLICLSVVIVCGLGASADTTSAYNQGYNSINSLTGGYSGLTGAFSSVQPVRGGLPTLASYRGYGYPRRLVRFFPVPIVKKVTHHHIHHVIAHKGVIKSKYSPTGTDSTSGALDFNNSENTKNSDNYLTYKEFRENNTLNGDFNDNGYKSSFFNKRAGDRHVVPLAPAASTIQTQQFGRALASQLSSMGATGATVGNGGAIRGFIGDQKADFLPVVIGIIDDGSSATGADFYPNSGQYSSRKGLLRGESQSKRPYIPSKETIKLFEDLAKLGF